MRPLEGVRVIAVEQYGAGPWGSLHLADLGADVIKVEDPRTRGDIGRYVPPFQQGEDSLFFETLNRNKRSISLDLTNAAGRGVFEDLVRSADAVYSNLRGDVPTRLRIRYQDLAEVNKQIVCCTLSAFGLTGPRQADPGYDYVIQGLAGWMTLTGEPGGPPQKTGLSLVDFSGGLAAGFALVSGVLAARRDGVGMDCDVSLYETALSMLTYQATWHLSASYQPERTRHSAHPTLVPFQNFPTSDGWVVIACPKDKFFHRLLEILGLSELATDERYLTFATRFAHREELLAVLEDRVQQWSSDELLAALRAAGVPCAPINDVPDALRDPQIEARQMIVLTEHPTLGSVRSLASPIRVGPPPPEYRRAPRRNEDATAILTELLGHSHETVEAYRAAGAFGSVQATEVAP